MKSNTKISKQAERKTNPELVETIVAAKKNVAWKRVAEILTSPRRIRPSLNLDQISELAESNKKVLIPGKVLSQGNTDKKIKVVALNFSEKAKEKLKSSGCDTLTILE